MCHSNFMQMRLIIYICGTYIAFKVIFNELSLKQMDIWDMDQGTYIFQSQENLNR